MAALNAFRYRQRWSGLHVPADLAESVPLLEQRDRELETWLQDAGVSIDALRALTAGYIKANGTGGFSAQAIPIPASDGGTGQAGGYAVGDLLYATAAATLARLADVATGNALISGGVTVAPSWGKIGLTTHVSGTLGVGNGGTGTTTHTSGNFLLGAGGSAITSQAGINYANVNTGSLSSWTPTLTGITLGNSTQVANYIQIGRLYIVHYQLTVGSTAVHSTNPIGISLPSTPITTLSMFGGWFDASIPATYAILWNNRLAAARMDHETGRIPASDVRYTTAAGAPAIAAVSDILWFHGAYLT